MYTVFQNGVCFISVVLSWVKLLNILFHCFVFPIQGLEFYINWILFFSVIYLRHFIYEPLYLSYFWSIFWFMCFSFISMLLIKYLLKSISSWLSYNFFIIWHYFVFIYYIFHDFNQILFLFLMLFVCFLVFQFFQMHFGEYLIQVEVLVIIFFCFIIFIIY